MQQHSFQHIFREKENDRDFLKEVTERYPYFGAAHFFLLKNTDKADPAFEATAARAGVFFEGAFLPELMLQKEEKIPEIPKEEASIIEEIKKEEQVPEVIKEEATPEPQQEVKPAPEAPLFEPLHATDYFASQGIKLSEDALNADKLGQQLKSFTAWLKTMKKVHPDRMGTGAANETVIQHLAEKSNMEEEVVTEAMAEAYVQQGKHAQAIEIWSKLSLQNPSKSAYFAAKIDSLKY